MAEAASHELEEFRLRWQEEVAARNRGITNAQSSSSRRGQNIERSLQAQPANGGRANAFVVNRAHEDEQTGNTYDFDDLEERENRLKLGKESSEEQPRGQKEPESALEHFERAVEKEAQGNLGESLLHYRTAYKVLLNPILLLQGS